MMTMWSVLVPLAQQGPDPNDVKPGWLGLTVFLVLLAAVVLLSLSLRKHLNRVNFEEKPVDKPAEKPLDKPLEKPADGSSGA